MKTTIQDAIRVWEAEPSHGDLDAALNAVVVPALASVAGVVRVVVGGSSAGSRYYDLFASDDVWVTVRVSNHAARHGGHVWSFGSSDTDSSVERGLIEIGLCLTSEIEDKENR